MSDQIDKCAINNLNEIRKKKEVGENLEPEIEDAVEAIEFANNLVNTIMKGRHVDLAFFRLKARSLRLRAKKRSQKK